MPFTKTTWVDGSAPAITAAQLNRIETGIEDAHAGSIDANAIQNAALRQSAATSVMGRSANSTGNVADIAAASDGQVLRRASGALGFGQIATAGITDDAVDNSKLRNSAALSVIGRTANSVGDPGDIAAGTDGHVLRRAGTALGFGQVVAAGIADGAVTTAKIGDGQVTTAKIGDGQVSTAKIGDSQVTTAKIGNSQVTTAKIGDSQVTTAKIGDGQVTAAKVIATGLAGYVVQHVVFSNTASFFTKSTQPVEDLAGMTITITPKSGSNRIFLMWSGLLGAQSGSGLDELDARVILADASNNTLAFGQVYQATSSSVLKELNQRVTMFAWVNAPGAGAKTYKTRWLRGPLAPSHQISLEGIYIAAFELAV